MTKISLIVIIDYIIQKLGVGYIYCYVQFNQQTNFLPILLSLNMFTVYIENTVMKCINRIFFIHSSGEESLFSFSTSWMWKISLGKLPCPRTWNNIKIFFSDIPWRKLGKNVNLFHLNMNFFLKSNRKSITLFNCRDVEIEPGYGKWAARIIWALRIKWAFFKEYFDEVSWKKKAVYYFFKI